MPFHDAPEAVDALAAQGADFVTGDGHMTLVGKRLESGEAVWETIVWDVVYRTPFARGE